MVKRFGVVVAVALALVVFALAGCSGSGSDSSSSSSGSGPSVSAATVSAEGVVTILLDYNAGTGFEWVCSEEPEGVVSEVGHATVDKAADQSVAGGPLQEEFVFRAVKPGEVTLTFELVRPWEAGDPAETQVYAFTVSDDLKMTLNPYKSDFVNEPEWEANS